MNTITNTQETDNTQVNILNAEEIESLEHTHRYTLSLISEEDRIIFIPELENSEVQE